MAKVQDLEITDRWILSHRGKNNPIDPVKPYAFHVEKERTAQGNIQDVITIFLTNRECPYHCLMCDLWKNTTDSKIEDGAIPSQIQYALDRLSPATQIKLYNSGSFFDKQAIPKIDYSDIATLLSGFEQVIVESHPNLISERTLDFRDLINGNLEVAVGLETVYQKVLEKLNKRMSLDDFQKSITYLNKHDISSRAFILLRPPFMTEKEGIEWAKKSIEFAFDAGVSCCIVIPTRAGNGAMDQLQRDGFFQPPQIQSLEEVLDYGIQLKAGRVFADLWDLKNFSSCDLCFSQRHNRLESMNHHQQVLPHVSCSCSRS